MKLNKILISLTFLIALFFFVKWINDVRPKYEWQETIFTCDESKGEWLYYYDMYGKKGAECHINKKDKLKDYDTIFWTSSSSFFTVNSISCNTDNCYIYCETSKGCYKKEKIKIN